MLEARTDHEERRPRHKRNRAGPRNMGPLDARRAQEHTKGTNKCRNIMCRQQCEPVRGLRSGGLISLARPLHGRQITSSFRDAVRDRPGARSGAPPRRPRPGGDPACRANEPAHRSQAQSNEVQREEAMIRSARAGISACTRNVILDCSLPQHNSLCMAVCLLRRVASSCCCCGLVSLRYVTLRNDRL